MNATPRPLRRRLPAASKARHLVVAMGVALCAAFPVGSAVAAVGADATVARPTALRNGDAVIGVLPAKQAIHVEVALRLRNKQALDALVAGNARRQAGGLAPQLMTPAQLLANHAPTRQQAQAVADFLTARGFRNVTVAPNRLLVSADGTAASAADAFATRFAQVRTRDGRIAYANIDAASVPAALADTVLAVVGLQSVHMAHTFVRRFTPTGVHIDALQGHFPTEFPTIYSGASAAPAAGITVGIVTEGNLNQTRTDLDVFTTNRGLPPVATATVNTNGTSSDTAGTDEWDLDSQDIVAMAGQVAQLVFYDIPSLSNANLTADYNTIVAANQAKIVNVSIGECETAAQSDGSAAADDVIFETAIAQGQTFAVASGDAGADECPADGVSSPIASWPAASQYVVAVGGTTLSASSTRWNNETVWSGSGGSPSSFEPMPAWQSSAGVPGTTRGVPDIAFDGDPRTGALVYFNLALAQFGGTSLSAPLFTGTWARILQVRGSGFGFAAPVLYALPAADFHDVTVGNNGLETAGAGYDFASGRGSMLLAKSIANSAGLGNQRPQANFGFAITGTNVDFSDASTDADGTLVSHAWNFGDGSTSTQTSPSHDYGKGGRFVVRETVTDNDGATDTATQAVVLTTGPVQLIRNTGFESGKAPPWVASNPALINSDSAEPAFSGTWDAWLGRHLGPRADDEIHQVVTIPSTNTRATLSFELHIDTNIKGVSRNFLEVMVKGTSGRYQTLAKYGNSLHANGYTRQTVNLTPFVGQTITLKFQSIGDTLLANFVIDDVTLVAR